LAVRVLVFLESGVPAFAPREAQVARLAARVPTSTFVTCRDRPDFLAQLPEAEAVIVWSFERDLYPAAPALRHVFTPAAGRELISADPAGRVSLHFGSFHGHLMAESLLGMMLFQNRRFGIAIDRQRAHQWDRAAYVSTRRLRGQTALLVGYGAIGEHCGALLKSVGMRVHGVRRDPSRGGLHADRIYGVGQLAGAVADADHVACIVPGDHSTDGLIDAELLARMKPSAQLYNLGRGNAVDMPALVAALRAQRLAGAFLDVVPEEPPPADSPLWDVPNLYLTPHASAISSQYLDLYFDELAEKLPGES
jgi:phosphoglycerate dehydrogenase-like enzyme